jgi:hypothetical protein
MKHLQAYIDRNNKWNSLFSGNKVIYEVATAQGREFIARRIDADLSPENLSCDGELPRAEVQRRYRELTSAARELINLDPTMEQYIYEFCG